MVEFILLFSYSVRAEVQINEVQWSNQSHKFPDIKGSPDWVEIINTGNSSVDLSGIGISDDYGEPFKFVLPSEILRPGQLRLIYLSGNESAQDMANLPEISSEDAINGLQLLLRSESINIDDSTQVDGANKNFVLRRWNSESTSGNRYANSLNSRTSPTINLASDESVESIRFDGTDDRLIFRGMQSSSDDFTWTFIVKPEANHEIDQVGISGAGGVEGQKYLFWPEHGGELDAGVGLSAGQNGLTIYEHGSGYMPARLAYSRDFGDQFRICSFSYQGGIYRLYINGILWETSEATTRRNILEPLSVGGGAYGYFDGSLRYLSSYSRALSNTEILSLHNYLGSKYQIPLFHPVETPFKLKNGEEPLVVTARSGERLDIMNPIHIPRDFSYGRSSSEPDALGIFPSPSPGGTNDEEVYKGWLNEPKLTHKSGIYESSFQLNLIERDELLNIHYTLDGSEPDENDPVIDLGGLKIDSSLRARRKLMDIRTSSAWTTPTSTWHRAIVISVRSIKPGYVPSPVVRRTFIIHPKGNQLFSLPVFSLFINPDDFFSSDRGIYVPGDDPRGNFWNKGRDWERPAFLELFEPGRPVSFSEEMGVRIFGGTSRQFPQKSLRFYTERNPENRPLRHQLFPDSRRRVFDKFILRQSGHDHHFTFIRDGFMTGIGREAGIETQLFRPSLVFINGEFWGIHNLRESFDEGYFESHHSVDRNALNIVEGFFRPDVGDASSLLNLDHILRTNTSTVSTVRDHINDTIDVENFLTYKAIETFFYRWDTGNLKRWKSDQGKWRWIWFDTDVGSGGFASVPPAWDFPMLDYNLEAGGAWDRYPLNNHNNPTMTRMFRSVISNPEWKNYFINRYCDLLNTTLQKENLLQKINQLQSQIRPYMIHQIRRWGRPASLTEWNNQLDHLREFATERQGPALEHLQKFFKAGQSHNLTIHNPSTHHGHVELNSLGSDDLGASFSGNYFANIPIEIRAHAKEGFKFAGWQEIPGVTNPELKLKLRGDTTLTPIFFPILATPSQIVIDTYNGEWMDISIQPEIVTPTTEWVLEKSYDLKTWTRSKQGVGAFGRQRLPIGQSDGNAYFRLRIN